MKDIVYWYDGSFDGLLCCVFESYRAKEIPSKICEIGNSQLSFFESKYIDAETNKAQRVKNGVIKTAGKEVYRFVQYAYLTCMKEKEYFILMFLRMAFAYGNVVMRMLADDVCSKLDKAVRFFLNEVHLFKGFVRFSVCNDVLVARISPKNFVLPLLANHFINRFPTQKFIIYDKTHKMALLYDDKSTRIIEAKDYVKPIADDEEIRFQKLWKMYYDTIAIKGRENPSCRRTHMPKRYWENMTEFTQNTGQTLFALSSRLFIPSE